MEKVKLMMGKKENREREKNKRKNCMNVDNLKIELRIKPINLNRNNQFKILTNKLDEDFIWKQQLNSGTGTRIELTVGIKKITKTKSQFEGHLVVVITTKLKFDFN